MRTKSVAKRSFQRMGKYLKNKAIYLNSVETTSKSQIVGMYT